MIFNILYTSPRHKHDIYALFSFCNLAHTKHMTSHEYVTIRDVLRASFIKCAVKPF